MQKQHQFPFEGFLNTFANPVLGSKRRTLIFFVVDDYWVNTQVLPRLFKFTNQMIT